MPEIARHSAAPATPPILGGTITSRVSCAGTTLTAHELRTRIDSAARRLAARGVTEGDRVAVDSDDAVARLCWFLGTDVVGAAALLVEPAWPERERAAILDRVRPSILVGSSIPGCEVPDPGSTPPIPAGDQHTYFYLPTTSGSSGTPRVLVRTRLSWIESFRVFELGLEPSESILVPGPLTSSLFLFGALHALHEGHDLQLLPEWSAAAAAEECRSATVLHVVPAMLSALLSIWERQPEPRADCALTKIVCGGARVDTALEERLKRVLPGCELIEYYGSAEHSLVAMRRNPHSLRPVVEVDIRDDDGSPLPPGRPGRLWVRSELAFAGYLGATEPLSRNGWSSVGDRAVLHPDGTLAVHGRSCSTIDCGGTLVSAEDVEAALRSSDGVLDVVVAATPHPRLGSVVTAVLETDRTAPPSLSDLRSHARKTLEPAERPRRWLTAATLPRTTTGKPARALVTDRLREGTLAAEVLGPDVPGTEKQP